MTIHNLFPIPIGRYKLDRKLTNNEITLVEKQNVIRNIGNKTSENKNILEETELKNIKKFIQNSIDDYFDKVYDPKTKVNLQITQSWSNYTNLNEWHHKHDHSNSFISGVFYIQANNQNDKIYFCNEKYSVIKINPKNWNIWNSESWWFDVGVGDLIIFPSSLTHMVEPIQKDQTRISLSFNTFLVGEIGNPSERTLLNIEKIS
jgi:uncharacterized protein (TIGR02466 family)